FKKRFLAKECVFQKYSPSILNNKPTAKKSGIVAKSIPPIHDLFSKSGNGLIVASISSHVATDVSKSSAGPFIRLVINRTLALGLLFPSDVYCLFTVLYNSSA